MTRAPFSDFTEGQIEKRGGINKNRRTTRTTIDKSMKGSGQMSFRQPFQNNHSTGNSILVNANRSNNNNNNDNADGNYICNDTPQSFDLRAPPRRRIKGDDPEDQPLFLRKAYTMITDCPSEIGGWSANGETVLIKDVKLFAERIIPTAYKHNNFSSFVRQLNFYGFRKVKSESMNHPAWWEFRHPSFVRCKPQLLSEIKRSFHYEAPNNQEVIELKTQVTTLNDRVAKLHEQIEELSGALTHLQFSENVHEKEEFVEAKSFHEVGKKRRMSSDTPPVLTRLATVDSIILQNNQLQTGPELSRMDIFHSNNTSVKTERSVEDDFDLYSEDLMDLFTSEDSFVTSSPRPHEEQLQPSRALQQSSVPLADIVSDASSATIPDISSILEGLTPDLKVRFVDRLAEEMSKLLIQQMTATHTTAVTAIKQESTEGYVLPSGSKAPEIALPLATAALGAFMFSHMSPAVIHQQVVSQVKGSSVEKKECAQRFTA